MAAVDIIKKLVRHYRDNYMASPDFEITAKGLLLPGRHALYEFFDDFNAFTVAASGVTGWIKQETGTGTAAAVQDEAFGVIKFVTGTTAGSDSTRPVGRWNRDPCFGQATISP